MCNPLGACISAYNFYVRNRLLGKQFIISERFLRLAPLVLLAATAVLLVFGVYLLVFYQDITVRFLTATTAGALAGAAVLLAVATALFWYLKNQNALLENEVTRRTQHLEHASARFKLMTDNAYDLISIVDGKGLLEYSNSAYHRILGFTRDELRGQNLDKFVHQRDLDALMRILHDVVKGKNAAELTFRMRHKKGNWVYLEAVAKGIHDPDSNLTNVVIHCRDVTSKKMYAEELARSEQRFRDFSEASADWLWEADNTLGFTYVSPGIKGVLGYDAEDMVGKNQLDTLFEKANDPTRRLIENRINRQQPYRDVEFWTRAKSGENICMRLSGVPIYNEHNEFDGYRGAATNITTSKLDREHMFRLATTDHLTGLLNRNRFMEELDRTVSLSRRHRTQGVLLFIDLDQFKHINDSYGHDAGDILLKSVAGVLKKAVRSTDVVARLGGDEFGIIMHKIDIDRARQKVQQIIEQVNHMDISYKSNKLRVTMSIGMITYPQEDQDGANLFMSADLAMYRAKDMGRNRLFVEVSNGEGSDSQSLKEQLKWVDILRKALDNNEFEVHFQPIIPVTGTAHTHYEALIRLRDENGNIGAPYLFIDAAEHFGLIQHLDLKVIDRCMQIHKDMKKKRRTIPLAINLSSRSLGDQEVIRNLRDIIKTHNIEPNCFTFEITDTAAIHDPTAYRDIEEVKEFIDELRALGFKFALDDFGVGFSSFNYIRRLNVDMLKIDGSYVKNLDKDNEDGQFVRAIVELAKGLGIQTVAEFVENEAILQKLHGFGVDFAQGYYLSRPEADLLRLDKTFAKKCGLDFMNQKPAHNKISA